MATSSVTQDVIKYAFFVHGYPNGPNVFNKYVTDFTSKGFKCVSLNFRTGVSIEDNVNKLYQTIKSYETLDAFGKRSNHNILIGHDWGASESWDLIYDNPDIIDLFIPLSIPLNIRPLSIYEDGLEAFKSFYQLLLIFVYYISLIPIIGVTMASYIRAILSSSASKDLDNKYPPDHEEYYYKWIGWFVSFRIFVPHYFQTLAKKDINRLKYIPILGMRGTDNREFINDSLFWDKNSDYEIKILNPHNEIAIFPTDGHWFYLTKYDQTLAIMLNFIDKNIPK
jgi:pimeloyl-ACP methyl ester carboxylesterase